MSAIRLFRGSPDSSSPASSPPSSLSFQRRRTDRPAEPPPPSPTLRQIFDRFKRPELEASGRKKCSIQEYTRALDRWEKYWAARRGVTDAGSITQLEPGCDAITTQQLAEWRAWLLAGEVPSNRTANKHIGVANALLACAADFQLASRPPRLKPLPAIKAAPKAYLTYEQICQLYRACRVATWPRGLAHSPATYLRAAIVLFFNYGFRTQELFSLHPQMTPLLWSQISSEPESPHPDGHAKCEWGWLWYLPEKQKRAKPDPLVLPLNATVASHLKSIKPTPGDKSDPRVFPFPKCARDFYGQWDEIFEEAGVKPKRSLSAAASDAVPKFHLKNLRKTCNTWHNYHERGSGEWILGHAARDVNGSHYDNAENLICKAIAGLPQPDAFFSINSDRQQLLFQ